jgi:hypothetical protein
MAYPLTNALRSSTNYTIEPREHFKALRHAERRVGRSAACSTAIPTRGHIRHPPTSASHPIPTWLYVVVGMERRDEPVIRAFRIIAGSIHDER